MLKDMLSPSVSPNTLFGGRRPNDLPLYIAGGIVTVFLIVVATAAAGRASTAAQITKKEALGATGDSLIFAHGVVADNLSGIVPPTEDEAPPILIISEDDSPPLPDRTAPVPSWSGMQPPANAAPMLDDSTNDPRMQAVRQAAAAKTAVKGAEGRGARAFESMPYANTAAHRAGQDQDPDERFARRLKMTQEVLGVTPGGGAGSGGLPASSSGGGGYGQFNKNAQPDRWKLESKVENPRTAFELRAGSVVPAVLLTGINSDIPGAITAQVSQNVYDTATGEHLLIPQGAKLIGAYDSSVIFGQSRLLVAWQRIVFPDGKALDIGAMPGSDGVGYAGLGDKVNNHYIRTFASALMMSFITAGISMSQEDSKDSAYGRKTASSAMSEALGQQLGNVATQVIMKHMNVSPTLVIRPGFIFNVVATQDIAMQRPYQSFDYNTAKAEHFEEE